MVSAAALALFLGGAIWAARRPSVPPVAQPAAAELIRRCEVAAVVEDRTKEVYCPMKVLLAP